ncbi:isocitrate lyase/phosphoenolpyruvate mutase family protein [Micromonospora tulbaghiae]|uniref:isocitrate lyase/phosphoenolpyruvate mutase family protein n=1 Tax=Micromonospora tulbaghiae TaxID=479978 RepID=UPI0036833410
MTSRRPLREVMARGNPALAFGAHDALTAVLGERAGFDAIWASGFGISTTMALPDLNLLGMSDHLVSVRRMAAACGLPVLADVDCGFGGPLNLAYAVMMYEQAGVGGICVEDQQFPKTNSFVSGRQQLVDADEFAAKVEAGKRAQQGRDFMLVARTEAMICGRGVDEALRRAHRYVDAGADAVLVHSSSDDPREVIEFLRRWGGKTPAVVIPTTYVTLSAQRAGAEGAAMVVYANQALRAAVRAISEVATAVRADRSTRGVESRIATLDAVFEITDLHGWLDLER